MIAAYLAATALAVVLDATWIGFVMKGFYRSRLATYLAPQINWYAAIVLYLILAAGIFYFAAYPAFLKHSAKSAFCNGLLIGFLVYAVYDLTNLATFSNWRIDFAAVDIAWGTLLCGIVSLVGYFLLEYFV